MYSIRRVAALRSILQLPSVVSPPSRCYATPTIFREVTDPQLNGYPTLPNISRQSLPPKGWTDEQMRRNFGDTLHEKEELYSMWGPDVPVVPPPTALRQVTFVTLAFIAFGCFVKYALVPDLPAARREYPFSGLVKELGGLEENKAIPESEED